MKLVRGQLMKIKLEQMVTLKAPSKKYDQSIWEYFSDVSSRVTATRD
jgi:hypothetical protein